MTPIFIFKISSSCLPTKKFKDLLMNESSLPIAVFTCFSMIYYDDGNSTGFASALSFLLAISFTNYSLYYQV